MLLFAPEASPLGVETDAMFLISFTFVVSTLVVNFTTISSPGLRVLLFIVQVYTVELAVDAVVKTASANHTYGGSNLRTLGISSTNVTPLAMPPPMFFIVIVYTIVSPVAKNHLSAVLVISRSGVAIVIGLTQTP